MLYTASTLVKSFTVFTHYLLELTEHHKPSSAD